MKLRRPSGAWIVSVVVHLLVAVLFVRAILSRHAFFLDFGNSSPAPVVERVRFATLPRPEPRGAGPVTAGRSGGDNRAKHATVIPMPPAPTTVPTIIPPAPKGPPVAGTAPSSGPLIGGGGPLRGVQPRYEDPRVWTAPDRIAETPKTPVQRLDSVIANDIGAYNDSVRVANGGKRAPGDWTFEKNGQKYGMDSKFIRLGPVSIPTAILALLPINLTGNPTTYERNKTLTSRHDEIFEQARRGMNDADFDKAVKSIRERKEREHEEAEAARKKAAEQATWKPDSH